MNQELKNFSPIFSLPLPKLMFCVTGLALFWVVFLWGVLERYVLALGFNATLFMAGLLLLTHFALGERSFVRKCAWYWYFPLLIVCLSYSVFENPFIKLCHMLFIPMSIGFLTLMVRVKEQQAIFESFVRAIFASMASAVETVFGVVHASALYHEFIASRFLEQGMRVRPEVRSVFKGVALLALLSVFVVVPLLGSADAAFQSLFENVYQRLTDIVLSLFELEYFWRLLAMVAVSVFCLAFLTVWTKDVVILWKIEARQRDQISAGVIILGIVVLYVVFLYLQLDKILQGGLPLEFRETEAYVKSGFWQLVMLTGLNLALVFTYYRHSSAVLKMLLFCFVMASLLLLGSAAHRMFLYVTFYGLSYEKFYASYTVLYCAVLFAVILCSLGSSKVNLTRAAILIVLWMYAAASITPVEYIVARTNLALSYRSDSRLSLSDIKIMSIDALPFVKSNKPEIVSAKPSAGRWHSIEYWILEQEQRLDSKRWYEYSLSALFAARTQ